MSAPGYIPLGAGIRFQCADGTIVGFVVGVLGDREHLIIQFDEYHYTKIPLVAVKLGRL
jgi:hypothetical protein